MRGLLLSGLVALAGLSCDRSLELPPSPDATLPGSVSGRLSVFKPGRLLQVPAQGAAIRLSHSNVSTLSGSEDEFFLSGVTSPLSALQIELDSDGDGRVDRQRHLALAGFGGGPGKNVSLGELILGRNAAIVGRVRRADLPEGAAGNGGIEVFVPESPHATLTADDGSFALETLPEGQVALGFFRDGYQPAALEPVSLRGGETFEAQTVVLTKASASMEVFSLEGLAQDASGLPMAGVTVRAWRNGMEFTTTTDGSGAYRFENLPPGRYEVSFEQAGSAPLSVPNVVVTEDTVVPRVTFVPGTPSVDAGVLGPLWLSDGGVLNDGRNLPPVAAVKTHQAARLFDVIYLDGSNSFDPEGETLVYHWELLNPDPSLPIVLANNDTPFAAQTHFMVPQTFQQDFVTLKFKLQVKDVAGNFSAPVYTEIFASLPPVSVARVTPSSAAANQAVTLDGTGSYDPRTLPLTYLWKVAGAVVLQTPSPTASYYIPDSAQGPFTLSLVVSNGVLESDAYDVSLTIQGKLPPPDAGTPDAGG